MKITTTVTKTLYCDTPHCTESFYVTTGHMLRDTHLIQTAKFRGWLIGSTPEGERKAYCPECRKNR